MVNTGAGFSLGAGSWGAQGLPWVTGQDLAARVCPTVPAWSMGARSTRAVPGIGHLPGSEVCNMGLWVGPGGRAHGWAGQGSVELDPVLLEPAAQGLTALGADVGP